MSIERRQKVIAGTVLIGLGFVWWLNLWWLLLPGALVAGGVAAYLQRRANGRYDEALQGALWGIGLGLLFLLNFVWPGILFLAGASVLLRGREAETRQRIEQTIVRVRQRSRAQRVPVDVAPTTVTVESGDTTRL